MATPEPVWYGEKTEAKHMPAFTMPRALLSPPKQRPSVRPSVAYPSGVVDVTSQSYFHRLLHQKLAPPQDQH
eukprot:6633562-Pyramimonas_sp.AAC.1